MHDPKNVIFFSDEAYRWLVNDGGKASLTYNSKEYEQLNEKAQVLIEKLKATPQDVEKVAFVIIKENEPVHEPAPKYVPSGLPRGRPAKPDSEKKAKKEPSGRPRGRPAKSASEKEEKPAAPGRRGRPPTKAAVPKATTGRGPGRPPKVKVEEATSTPVKSGKRKADDAESTPRSGKRAKA